ncbi:HAD family hydrolase [Bacteroidota bacterium]
MKKEFSYVAAFDLDKTIVSVNSSRLIVKASRRLGLMSKGDFLRAILYSIIYKFDLKDANKIVEDMTKWLKGLKESDIIKLLDEHVIQDVLKLVRPEIRKVLENHRKNGARLVMLSSAMPYICNPIADHLNMDDVVSSRLEVSDGEFTGRPIDRLNFGKQKAVTMKKFCEDNDYSLEESYYYGDAYTDRYVLEIVGHAVCVHPEIKLRSMAKRKNWEII